MVRVKQWADDDKLSYLLVEPVSRRSALIDPVPVMKDEYQRVLQMRGLNNLYVLFTFQPDDADLVDVEGTLVTPETIVTEGALPLGETHIERFVNASSALAAYVCEGHLFSGHWLIPFALRQINAGDLSAESGMLPLVNFPDDHIIHPGKMVSGIRISTIAQEKALAEVDKEGVFHG